MKAVVRWARLIVGVTGTAAVLASCDAVDCLVGGCGDPNESAAPPPLRLVVTGQVAALAVGDSGSARVDVTGGSGTTRVQWSVSGDGGAVILDGGSTASARVQYVAARPGTARIGLVVVSGAQTAADTAAVTVSVR
jgi:hypothetical protein